MTDNEGDNTPPNQKQPEYYFVRNWHRFQHYHHRNPPWIKLHFELLSSPDWVTLSNASRVLAIACMLIASRNSGKVPNNPDYIKRVSHLFQKPNFKPLIECGFLTETLADASLSKRLRTNATPEIELDISSSIDRTTNSRAVAKKATRTPPTNETFERFWAAYPSRGTAANPKKPALQKFERLMKAGADAEAIIGGAARFCAIEKAAGRWGTEMVAMAVTWLNQERWSGYPSVSAEVKSAKFSGFYAGFSSPQLAAWDEYERHSGSKTPRDQRGGWTFPTEYPPGYSNGKDRELLREQPTRPIQSSTTHPSTGVPTLFRNE